MKHSLLPDRMLRVRIDALKKYLFRKTANIFSRIIEKPGCCKCTSADLEPSLHEERHNTRFPVQENTKERRTGMKDVAWRPAIAAGLAMRSNRMSPTFAENRCVVGQMPGASK